jgi:hypothetical protein
VCAAAIGVVTESANCLSLSNLCLHSASHSKHCLIIKLVCIVRHSSSLGHPSHMNRGHDDKGDSGDDGVGPRWWWVTTRLVYGQCSLVVCISIRGCSNRTKSVGWRSVCCCRQDVRSVSANYSPFPTSATTVLLSKLSSSLSSILKGGERPSVLPKIGATTTTTTMTTYWMTQGDE